ncbi:MAG: late competence development ComFB family protein [Cyanobacteriota bacterium]|nr:late competence development ComFB family protein [Cyanobacteriota bacterium]
MELKYLNLTLNALNFNAINVMQILVLQEVDRQLQKLTPSQAQYIQPLEVVAKALNSLPSLYAVSQEDLSHQLDRAKQQYDAEIIKVVRQSVTAVQYDPQNDWMRLLCL